MKKLRWTQIPLDPGKWNQDVVPSVGRLVAIRAESAEDDEIADLDLIGGWDYFVGIVTPAGGSYFVWPALNVIDESGCYWTLTPGHWWAYIASDDKHSP